ncbi:Ornithine decarboxylase [Linum perenne]
MVAIFSSGLQGIITAPGVKGRNVTSLSNGGLTDFLRSIIIDEKDPDAGGEPFYVLDLGIVASLMDAWSKSLPMVHPFYAVKCNPDKALLGTLAHLGASFDCASRAEIESVLAVGVSPDKIVFANPCKPESHIKYAAAAGVNLTTFDSVDELEKLSRLHPKCALLIRIKPPEDGGARCPLGPKYGALEDEIEPLLITAQDLRLPVVGASFHIGSGATESGAYRGAIAAARSVFDTATRLGLPRMNMLDIGGGFTSGSQFEDAASEIRAALNDYFSDEPGLKVISEPGRFLSESAFTLAATIIGKRVRGGEREYWINDGLYGSMNCILYDHATVRCAPLAIISNPVDPTCEVAATYSSTVFGPTCDALDTVFTGRQLPELKVNDWLVFPNMGAYTAAAGSNFNGFNADRILTHLAYTVNPN